MHIHAKTDIDVHTWPKNIIGRGYGYISDVQKVYNDQLTSFAEASFIV